MKSYLAVVTFTLGCLGAANTYAGGAIAGATEPTQILNNIQLMASYAEEASQTVTQIQQYQTMLQNLQRLTPSSLLNQAAQKLFVDQNMLQTFKSLQRVVVAGQQTSYTLANIDQRFKQMHQGYGANGLDFSRSYRDWSGNTLNSVRNSLALISAHSENFDSEQEMVSELMERSQTANGQMQVMQAANQIGVAMVGQMQQLRQLQMAQGRAQADYMAQQVSEKDHRNTGYDKIFDGLGSPRLK